MNNSSNNKDILEKIIKNVQLVEYKQGQLVYWINDVSNCVYIILKGTINLYTQRGLEEIDQLKANVDLNDYVSNMLDSFKQIQFISKLMQKMSKDQTEKEKKEFLLK